MKNAKNSFFLLSQLKAVEVAADVCWRRSTREIDEVSVRIGAYLGDGAEAAHGVEAVLRLFVLQLVDQDLHGERLCHLRLLPVSVSFFEAPRERQSLSLVFCTCV
jgi:hypothetical protein